MKRLLLLPVLLLLLSCYKHYEPMRDLGQVRRTTYTKTPLGAFQTVVYTDSAVVTIPVQVRTPILRGTYVLYVKEMDRDNYYILLTPGGHTYPVLPLEDQP